MQKIKKALTRQAITMLLALSLIVQAVSGMVLLEPTATAKAATTITKFEYYDNNNGPAILYKESEGLFSFLYPKINGEPIKEEEMASFEESFDILIKDENSGEWKNVNTLSYGENEDWNSGYWKWDGGGGWGIIFYGRETKNIRFQSKTDSKVYLDYFLLSPDEKVELSFDREEINVDLNGATLVDYDSLIVNNGALKGSSVISNIVWKIKKAGSAGFVQLDSAESGYTFGSNFGWDKGTNGNGAYWFNPIRESFTLRAEWASDSSIYADIDIKVSTEVDAKGDEYDFTDTSGDVSDPGTNKSGYQLVWSDEFDGNYGGAEVDSDTGLNLDNWYPMLGDGTEYDNTGWGNNERQTYTNYQKNIGVNEDGRGLLRITAAYEKDGVRVDGTKATCYYSSARLRTATDKEALFTTTYGYIEARMALPQTKGAWPAFWMLPQSTDIYGAWPVSGEIDIMETVGVNEDSACGTLHFGAPNHASTGSGYKSLDTETKYFHTYAVDWEPGKITWYYDGVPVHVASNWEGAMPGASASLDYDAPFDQPFHIILNLAVDSGSFGGAGNKATFQDDINMYVDYVRVYQREGGYADTAVRQAGSDAKSDWASYSGINQISDITEGCIAADTVNGDVNSLETAGSLESNKWYLAYQPDAAGAAAATVLDADGKTWANIKVASAGGQDYSTQLIGHYNAKAGYVYKISFDSYATGDMVGKQVNTDSKEWKGWSTYGSKVFTLTENPATTVYYISQNADFNDCRIEFNLGGVGTGNVYIGNVKVEIVDPATLGADTGSRVPLANGELIYNGTFDQGENRLGNWIVGENTTVKVPRYTKTPLSDLDNSVSVVDVASKLTGETADGTKYYARRAEISADAGNTPSIYQTGIPMSASGYTLTFDMYSTQETTAKAEIYSVNTAEDGTESLGTKLLESREVGYYDAGEVTTFSWNFEPLRALKNAALVLTFGDGASVQLDNVSILPSEKVNAGDAQDMDVNAAEWIEIKYVLNDSKNAPAENAESNPFYYKKGEGTIRLAAPSRAGYEFAGWSLVSKVQYVEDYVTEVSTNTDSITLYAQWGERVTAEKGPDGNDGQNGNNGQNGNDGQNGNNGQSGNDGQNGKDGKDGQNAQISMSIAKTTILQNETTQCTVLGVQNPAYTSSNPAVATVNEKGVVTGVSAGTAIITATATELGSSASVEITVVRPTVKWNVTYKTVPLQLKNGKKVNKTTVLQPTGLQNGDFIKSYKSSNTKIATVKKASNGKLTITPKKVGKTKITVYTNYGAAATFTLKVQKAKVKVTAITVNKTKVSLKKGKTFQITAVKKYITALDKVTYTSSNKKVAAVSSKGKITAKKKGKATITVKCGGKKKKIQVTVK